MKENTTCSILKHTRKKFDRQVCDLKIAAAGEDGAISLYAALVHPVRLAIFRQLVQEESYCSKDLVKRYGLAQSPDSQQLAVLVLSGFVTYRTEKQASLYQINPASFAMINKHMQELVELCVKGNCH